MAADSNSDNPLDQLRLSLMQDCLLYTSDAADD